jgi:thiol-disulfide isomerase/thioredoxin
MRRLGGALLLLALLGYGPVVVAQGPIFVPPPKTLHKQDMNLLDIGVNAPDWQLTDAEGKTHSLSEYRGKVVVMDFWATWCIPCSAVMPRMQKLHEKFAGSGVVVFGVNAWENSDPVGLMKKKGFSYELLLKGEGIAAAYKVTTLPVVYIIGYDGEVIYCHEGVDDKNLSSIIEKYFKANRVAKTI